MERGFAQGCVGIGQGGDGSELKEGRLRWDIGKKFFPVWVVRPWPRLPREAVANPLPGSVQGQVGWSSEHPGLVEDVPAHGRGFGTRWFLRSLPTQTILWFYPSLLGIHSGTAKTVLGLEVFCTRQANHGTLPAEEHGALATPQVSANLGKKLQAWKAHPSTALHKAWGWDFQNIQRFIIPSLLPSFSLGEGLETSRKQLTPRHAAKRLSLTITPS